MLIVAVHDVATAELSEVRWLLGRLDALGVTRRVLKVVPAAPGPPDDGQLLSLLRHEAEQGSELVLHGWSHRAEGPLRGRGVDRLRARLFAGGEAEFLSLADGEVADRVAAGRQWLDERGLPAAGFCPPGWLATAALPGALRRADFRYLVTLRGLRDLRRGSWVLLPPTGYMGTGGPQEALVRLGGAVLAAPVRLALRAQVRRIFLHPRAASRSADCARVLREIGALARSHRPVTYSELLDV